MMSAWCCAAKDLDKKLVLIGSEARISDKPVCPRTLQGKVVATAVNAPMVPPEVLAELQPYVALAQGLARAAVQLVSTAAHGFSDIYISYASSRGDDLDTRLLRAMVIKGILEQARPAGFGGLG